MKKYKIPLYLLLMLVFPQGICADDSIPATELQEIVVKSEREWYDNGIYNAIPSKKEKQLASSVGSLIDIMKIPMLKGEGDKISTIADEPVTVFINGQPANPTDLSTFWPKHVKKVEYMINPTGGQYTGIGHVLNFVVADYEVGGVSRIYGRQSWPLNGLYRLTSKLNYKKMSYGLLLDYVYSRKSPDKIYEKEIYNDIFYNGIKHEEISYTSSREQEEKYGKMNLVLNARYSTNNFIATHTFGLLWNQNPGTSAIGAGTWSENIFDSDSFSSFGKSKDLSPQLEGNYFFDFSDKWALGIQWDFAHSHNNAYEWTQFGNNQRIENGMTEDVDTFSGMIYLNYYPSRKVAFQISASSNYKWFQSSYSGSLVEKRNQFREETSAKFSAYWYPSKVLKFTLAPGIVQSAYKFANTKKRYLQPSIDFNGSWNPTRILSMNLFFNTEVSPATAGETNPIILRSSDLLWLSGNPLLKPQIDLYGAYSLSFFPWRWLSLSSRISYKRFYNYLCYTYEAAPQEMGGVIRTNLNSSPADDINANLSISFYLMNRKMNISAQPILRHFKTRGTFDRSLTDCALKAQVSYLIGNFYLVALYQSKNKVLDYAGNGITGQADQFSLGVIYSFKDLNIKVDIDNLFHSRFKTWQETYSDVYSSRFNCSSPGRGVTLSLTYTFGYGKEMERDMDMSLPYEVESSRLRNSTK
ncbi:MAG: hypothetical protein HDS97_08750 [Bacteroidales bacterium]|nr:hypothetical protein [Bacteroidales bacterium]